MLKSWTFKIDLNMIKTETESNIQTMNGCVFFYFTPLYQSVFPIFFTLFSKCMVCVCVLSHHQHFKWTTRKHENWFNAWAVSTSFAWSLKHPLIPVYQPLTPLLKRVLWMWERKSLIIFFSIFLSIVCCVHHFVYFGAWEMLMNKRFKWSAAFWKKIYLNECEKFVICVMVSLAIL